MIIALVPRRLLKKISDPQRAYAVNVLLSAFIALALIYAYKLSSGGLSGFNFCLFQHIFKIPCIGCGVSRSLFALYELSFFDSIMYNPCGILFLASIIAQIPLTALFLCGRIKFDALSGFNKAATVLIVSGLCAVWVVRLAIPSLLYPV